MKWEGREQSENVEDRRGMTGRAGMAVGGGGLLILLIATLLGFDPQTGRPTHRRGPRRRRATAAAIRTGSRRRRREARRLHQDHFSRHRNRLGRTLRQDGQALRETDARALQRIGEFGLRLGRRGVGPFYCPGDSKVYIDLEFYTDMQRKLNCAGEFARAYVVAHEVGHHVQRLLGYSTDRSDDGDINRASVRFELQADYLAGVWAYHGQERFQFLEPGDVETAIHAAFEIGDDRLQRKASGRVVPEKFTHGTSKQRQKWFMQGLKTGNVGQADCCSNCRMGSCEYPTLRFCQQLHNSQVNDTAINGHNKMNGNRAYRCTTNSQPKGRQVEQVFAEPVRIRLQSLQDQTKR